MKLKVVTPEREVLEEDVDSVSANATDGEVGILPKHIPMVTPLDVGVLRYVKSNQQYTVAVMGGLLQTNGQDVTVLTDAAETSDEIDELRAKSAQERAEARLKQDTDTDVIRAKQALARAVARVKAKNALNN